MSLSDDFGANYSWSATVYYVTGAGWLSLSPTSGTGLPDSISVGVNTPAMTGTYSATVVLTSAGGNQTTYLIYAYR